MPNISTGLGSSLPDFSSEEPEDLIGKNEENENEVDEGHLYFEWKCRDKKYRLK